MHGEMRRQTGEHGEAIAVEHAQVMIPLLDHDEEVARIGLMDRPRERTRRLRLATGANVFLVPLRRLGSGTQQPSGERGEVLLGQRPGKEGICVAGRPSRITAAICGAHQALQALGQQCWPQPPQRSGP